jgi:RNA recognition motif-containing protein
MPPLSGRTVGHFLEDPERLTAKGLLCPWTGEDRMGKKLYVGNLAYSVNDDELHQLFSAHGTVTSAQIISDRETGRSKGFGFVEMSSDEEAQNAMDALNGTQHGGRTLNVNEARPREPRRGGGGGGGGRGFGRRY